MTPQPTRWAITSSPGWRAAARRTSTRSSPAPTGRSTPSATTLRSSGTSTTSPTVLGDIFTPLDTEDPEDVIGERVLLLLLAIAVVYAAVFLLLPFVTVRRTWRALAAKGTSGVYFAALGLGFMFFEITMIQRLVLFLGYPTYSLTVTLASILVFTGIGALASRRLAELAALAAAAGPGGARRSDGLLPLRARPAHRVPAVVVAGRACAGGGAGPGAAGLMPGHVHAASGWHGVAAHRPRRCVCRLGLGNQWVLFRDRRSADDHPVDVVRLPGGAAGGAGHLRRGGAGVRGAEGRSVGGRRHPEEDELAGTGGGRRRRHGGAQRARAGGASSSPIPDDRQMSVG